jgi:hypothetical protein
MRKFPQNNAYVYSNMILYVGMFLMILSIPNNWQDTGIFGMVLGVVGMVGMKINDNGLY